MLKFLCLTLLIVVHALQSSVANVIDSKDSPTAVTDSLPSSSRSSSIISNIENDASDPIDYLVVPEDSGRSQETIKVPSLSWYIGQRYRHQPLLPFMGAKLGFGGASEESMSRGGPSSFKRYTSSTSSTFVPWAGKRAAFIQPSTPSFFPYEGKRFQAWAGKRAQTFRNWGGKRASDIQAESV